MTVQQSKHVAYVINFVIKTVVLAYNINIIICIQALRVAFIQHNVVFLTQTGLRICPPYSFIICIWIVIFNGKIRNKCE